MDGYEIDDVQKAISTRMSTYDAMGLLAFFLNKSAKYLRRFLTYSEKATKRVKNQTLRESLKAKIAQIRETLSRSAGAGSQTSMPSARRAGAPGRKSGK